MYYANIESSSVTLLREIVQNSQMKKCRSARAAESRAYPAHTPRLVRSLLLKCST